MIKPWARVMEVPWVYRVWQAPFQEQKLAPVLRLNDLSTVHRVLDVGCGPGTNAAHFRRTDYLGLDINADYVARARERYGMRFEVADVTLWCLRDEAYDFILVSSFFHHVSDEDTFRILEHLATLLTPDGRIHVLDLVLPDTPSPARLLARMDRGNYPRPLPAWHELLGRHFGTDLFQPSTCEPAASYSGRWSTSAVAGHDQEHQAAASTRHRQTQDRHSITSSAVGSGRHEPPVSSASAGAPTTLSPRAVIHW